MPVIKLEKVIYTAKAHTTGGRDGRSATSDGMLDVKLALPKEMGGQGGGTNPEQLFACGYSACFMSAMKYVAGQRRMPLPASASIDASVSIGEIPAGGFGLAVELAVHLPGMDATAAKAIVDAAHQVCPYSNATRGNIEVVLDVDTQAWRAIRARRASAHASSIG